MPELETGKLWFYVKLWLILLPSGILMIGAFVSEQFYIILNDDNIVSECGFHYIHYNDERIEYQRDIYLQILFMFCVVITIPILSFIFFGLIECFTSFCKSVSYMLIRMVYVLLIGLCNLLCAILLITFDASKCKDSFINSSQNYSNITTKIGIGIYLLLSLSILNILIFLILLGIQYYNNTSSFNII